MSNQAGHSPFGLHLKAVRDNVGMIDVSTLGGLDIRGPDAAEFVDRMYTWAYAKQPVARARFASA